MKIPDYNKKIKHPTYLELQEEIERLNNIIKEAREYIDYYGITPEQNDDVMVRYILKGILKILDKENNNV